MLKRVKAWRIKPLREMVGDRKGSTMVIIAALIPRHLGIQPHRKELARPHPQMLRRGDLHRKLGAFILAQTPHGGAGV